jgi:hypothetical protein
MDDSVGKVEGKDRREEVVMLMLLMVDGKDPIRVTTARMECWRMCRFMMPRLKGDGFGGNGFILESEFFFGEWVAL